MHAYKINGNHCIYHILCIIYEIRSKEFNFIVILLCKNIFLRFKFKIMELIKKSILIYILINVLCKNVIAKCPTNKPLAKCFVNPCKVSTCLKYPSAKCIPDYCGGCYAIWKYRNKIIKTCQDGERKSLKSNNIY